MDYAAPMHDGHGLDMDDPRLGLQVEHAKPVDPIGRLGLMDVPRRLLSVPEPPQHGSEVGRAVKASRHLVCHPVGVPDDRRAAESLGRGPVRVHARRARVVRQVELPDTSRLPVGHPLPAPPMKLQRVLPANTPEKCWGSFHEVAVQTELMVPFDVDFVFRANEVELVEAFLHDFKFVFKVPFPWFGRGVGREGLPVRKVPEDDEVLGA